MNIRINPRNVIITFLIILQFQFLYLVPNLRNLDYISITIFSAVVLMKYSKVKSSPSFFGKCFILLLFSSVLSCALSMLLFDGSFLSGLWSQRWIFIYILFYFAINRLINTGKLNYESIERIIYIVGTLQLMVYIIQYLFGDIISFTYVLVGERYGSARYYFNPILLIVLFFICLSKILSKQKILINISYIIAISFEVMIINKYRMSTLALIISFSFILLLFKGGIRKKLLIIIMGIFVLIQISQIQIFQDILSSLIVSDTSGTVEGRNYFRDWAIHNVLVQANFFGMGLVQTSTQNAYANHNIFTHYYIGDHGIWGMLYEYGILIIIFTVWLLVKLYRIAVKKVKSNSKYLYMGYALFILVDSYSENYWFLTSGLCVLALVLNMLESQAKNDSMREMQQVRRNV